MVAPQSNGESSELVGHLLSGRSLSLEGGEKRKGELVPSLDGLKSDGCSARKGDEKDAEITLSLKQGKRSCDLGV